MSRIYLMIPITLAGTFTINGICGLKQVEVITLGFVSNFATSSLGQLAPAYDVAAARFRLDHGRSFNLTHTYLVSNNISNCPDLNNQASYVISEWYYKKRTNADIFACIAPICLEFAEVNRLLASWDILLITMAVDDVSLRNKAVTPTALTVSPASFDTILGMYVSLLAYFNWTTVVIVFDQSALAGYHAMAAQIVPFLRGRHWQVTMYRVTSSLSMNFTQELRNFRLISRVLIFIGHAQPFRLLVIQASRLGMCNGEYVYIGFVVYKQKALGDFTWRYGDSDDELAREAFRSVLIIGPDDSIYALPDWTSFSAMTTGYVSVLNQSFPDQEPAVAQVSSVIAAFMVLGQVLDESFNGSNFPNNAGGRQLAQRLLGRQWDLGFVEVTLDEYGQRLIHEELTDMDSVTGEFKPVLQLQFTKPKTLLKLADIDWGAPANSSNSVPLNVPACGYTGDRAPCAEGSQLMKTSEVAILATALSVLFISFCSTFFYYSRRSHDNFADFLIPAHELTFRDANETQRTSRLRSTLLR